MAAIGELIVLLIYIFLAIPVLILVIRFANTKEKQVKIRRMVWAIISAVPLIIFSYAQFYKNRNSELAYVGIYELTEYPNCDFCNLVLMPNNDYEVRNGQSAIEKGKWKFKSGGDYWIVCIGEFGQLGSGKYIFENKNTGLSGEGE